MAYWFKRFGQHDDLRFVAVARDAKARIADVVAVWDFVMGHMSKAGGKLDSFDPYLCDFFYRFKNGTSARILQAFVDAGMLDEILSDPEMLTTRAAQTAKDGEGALSSTERSRRHRERQRAQRNADATEMQRDATLQRDENATGCNGMQRECNADATLQCNENGTGRNADATEMQRDATSPPAPPSGEIDLDQDLSPLKSPQGDGVASLHATLKNVANSPEGDVKNVTLPGANADEALALADNATPSLTPEKQTRTRRRYDYRNEDFKTWWAAYPNHEGEKPAKEAWDRLIKNNRLPNIDTLLKALEWQKQTQKWRDGYVYKAARYLKEEHFNDEPPAPRNSYSPVNGRTPYIRPQDEGNFKPLAPLLPKLPDGRPDYMDYMRNPEKYKELLQ